MRQMGKDTAVELSGNITSSWGTYMINPLEIMACPIPGGAILLDSLCIIVAILGFPMDWRSSMAPVMRVARMGVSLPLLGNGYADG